MTDRPPRDDRPRLFGLPPGADFAASLVAGLRQIQSRAGAPPEAMARLTLFVNSGRMRRAVEAAFCQAGDGFLPRLHLVTDLASLPELDLPPAASPLVRRLELMKLVAPFLRATAQAQSPLASEAALYDVADSLAALIDEMEGEDVPLSALETLKIDQSSGHWQRSLAYLRLIAPFLAEDNGAEALRRRAVAALAAAWQDKPPPGPVVVAGSTGSRGATLALMQAVAGLDQGMILVPGVDFEMPAPVWDLMHGALTYEDHPQFRIRVLADSLGLRPQDITPWPQIIGRAAGKPRAALVSLALRPAPVTDQWLDEGPKLPDLGAATEGMSLLVAPDPRAEAEAIALALRAALHRQERAVLVTPDRLLARRVTSALAPWRIEPDDSAGRPLGQSPPGRLLRMLAALGPGLPTIDRLLALLKHPLTATAAAPDLPGDAETGRGEHLRLTRELELFLRRKPMLHLRAADIEAFVARSATPVPAAWLAFLQTLAAPRPAEPRGLADWLRRHRAEAEALARGPAAEGTGALWQQEAGRDCLALMAEIETAATAVNTEPLTHAAYRALFEGLIGRRNTIEAARPDPRIAIIGPRELREAEAELIILAGLNEGTWPRMPDPDPWLNRSLRHQAGLLLPERQIGLSAHDVQIGLGARRIILSRAERDAEAPTVPSRWLNRLCNLLSGLQHSGGDQALAAMKSRGQAWLDLAARLAERVEPQPSAPRPSPAPPAWARPRRLSVTQIERLIRDPYEIYAQHVLRLKPLHPLGAIPDMRDRGTVFHAALERFASEVPPDETAPSAVRRLIELTRQELDASISLVRQRLEWLSLMRAAAPVLVAFHLDPQRRGTPILLEQTGSWRIEHLDFTLTAKVDRIDLLSDGTHQIIDYKTSAAPTHNQLIHFKKQLALTALIVERGGFEQLGPAPVACLTYLRIAKPDPRSCVDRTGEEMMLDYQHDWLLRWIAAYQDPAMGFTARRAMQKTEDTSDFDQLSRFGEWDITDDPVTIPLTQDWPT